ncbi:hypothetical protein CPC08DRAFT_633295 [Agrocybe pediades]|nr:hypothetical protein CPC08DRAFT_633295 [Agrocybe pediades]
MAVAGNVPNSEVASPLAYLPPQVAEEVATATYIHIGATGVLVWDFVNNLRNDYRIILHRKIGLQICAYILTRMLLLAYALGRALIMTSPIVDCAKIETAMNWILTAFVPLTTLTFYLRICSLYRDNLIVKVIYGMLWLSTLGMSITFNETFTAERLGPTNYCLEGVKNHFLLPITMIVLTNDLLIYFAVTYKLYTLFLDIESSTGQKLKLVLGTSLPAFSKAGLQDSQLYLL